MLVMKPDLGGWPAPRQEFGFQLFACFLRKEWSRVPAEAPRMAAEAMPRVQGGEEPVAGASRQWYQSRRVWALTRK